MSITKDLFRFFKRQQGDSKQEQIIIRDGMIVDPGSFKDYFDIESSDVLRNSQDAEAIDQNSQEHIPPSCNTSFDSLGDSKDTEVESKTSPGNTTCPIVLSDNQNLQNKDIADEEIAEKNKNDDPEKIKNGRPPKIDYFWNYLEFAGRGRSTIQQYRYDWKFWEKEARKKNRTPYTLRAQHIEEILKSKNPSTNRRKTAFLRTLAKWYLREGYPGLHAEVWKILSPKLPQRLPKDRGSEEFERLREKAKDMIADKNRAGLWIALKLLCGLRISEIKTAKRSGPGMIKVLGKGQKERLVPSPVWVLEGMKTIPTDGRGGWRQGRIVIWKALDKEGIRNPHSLRHTYASELKRRGKTIDEIQILLGHTNISTTTIYARTDVPDGVVDLLDS